MCALEQIRTIISHVSVMLYGAIVSYLEWEPSTIGRGISMPIGPLRQDQIVPITGAILRFSGRLWRCIGRVRSECAPIYVTAIFCSPTAHAIAGGLIDVDSE